MNIVGLDSLVFGVADVAAVGRYLLGCGLARLSAPTNYFAALDGTGVRLYHEEDPSLPSPLPSGSKLRQTVYGVRDSAALAAIRRELSRDREVVCDDEGALHTADENGFALRFQVTVRRSTELLSEGNSAGSSPERSLNRLGATAALPAQPLTLSHVVYFVPDAVQTEEFYVRRLGFVCTERIVGAGACLRPRGVLDRDILFLMQMSDMRWASTVLHFISLAQWG